MSDGAARPVEKSRFFSLKNLKEGIGYKAIIGIAFIAISSASLSFGFYPLAAILATKSVVTYSLLFSGAMLVTKIVQAVFYRKIFPKDRILMCNSIIQSIGNAAIAGLILGLVVYNFHFISDVASKLSFVSTLLKVVCVTGVLIFLYFVDLDKLDKFKKDLAKDL